MLSAGTRLGPYDIVAAIGAGGMGEVYRARDTRLDRTVAIKVLPASVAGDPDLRARFEREARAVAALNHPHICALYDVGEAPSHEPPATSHQPPDTIRFLVMEHLEGETLGARLARGALPLDQVFRYAIETADALDKAHRAGIVHRDLKPGNIFITKAGAKLLDFGLAKLGVAPASALIGMSVAVTRENLTAHGTILGTFQYMAPEQLEGQDADARTDIFAFGAVVHEMATGKKAFEGKSQASLVAAILEHDPPPIAASQPLTPPALDHIVRRCLAKDPDQRWQAASDVMRELKWIAESSATAPSATAAAAGSRPYLSRHAWPMAALICSFIVGAATAMWLGGRMARAPLDSMAEPKPVIRLPLTVPESLTRVPSQAPAVSPDGSRIALVAVESLLAAARQHRCATAAGHRPRVESVLVARRSEAGVLCRWSPQDHRHRHSSGSGYRVRAKPLRTRGVGRRRHDRVCAQLRTSHEGLRARRDAGCGDALQSSARSIANADWGPSGSPPGIRRCRRHRRTIDRVA